MKAVSFCRDALKAIGQRAPTLHSRAIAFSSRAAHSLPPRQVPGFSRSRIIASVPQFQWRSLSAAADSPTFASQSQEFLHFLNKGIADMQDSNPDLKLELTSPENADEAGELRVFVNEEIGWYTFQPDLESEEVVMISPKSGVKRYAYSDRMAAWLDTSDEHHCIQLLTGELIALCKGYPSF